MGNFQGAYSRFIKGYSQSDSSPGTSVTAGTNDSIVVDIDGDGAQTISLGTLSTGATIAAKIQTEIRALTPSDLSNVESFTAVTCVYQSRSFASLLRSCS